MYLIKTDALPEIYFDVRSRRFRYRDSKKFATVEAVKNQAQKYISAKQIELRGLATKYANGRLSLKELQTESAQIIKQIHVSSILLAIDKQNQVTGDRFLLVGRNLKQQYYSGKDPLSGDRYGLKHLFKEVSEGRVSEAQLANRLSLYGKSGKVSYWGIKQDIAKKDYNHTQARRVLFPGENCPNCIEYNRRGWVSIEDIILPTQACQCRTNCRCSVEFK